MSRQIQGSWSVFLVIFMLASQRFCRSTRLRGGPILNLWKNSHLIADRVTHDKYRHCILSVSWQLYKTSTFTESKSIQTQLAEIRWNKYKYSHSVGKLVWPFVYQSLSVYLLLSICQPAWLLQNSCLFIYPSVSLCLVSVCRFFLIFLLSFVWWQWQYLDPIALLKIWILTEHVIGKVHPNCLYSKAWNGTTELWHSLLITTMSIYKI